MPTAHSLVLLDGKYTPLFVRAYFTEGRGRLFLTGPVGQEIKVVLLAAINALNDVESFIDGFDPSIFGEKDLCIKMETTAPVVGESYGLALAVAILAAALRRQVKSSWVYTGCIGPAGEVLPVEQISQKRSAACNLGYEALVLPGSQLDMMNSEIHQYPVHNLREAFSVTFFND